MNIQINKLHFKNSLWQRTFQRRFCFGLRVAKYHVFYIVLSVLLFVFRLYFVLAMVSSVVSFYLILWIWMFLWYLRTLFLHLAKWRKYSKLSRKYFTLKSVVMYFAKMYFPHLWLVLLIEPLLYFRIYHREFIRPLDNYKFCFQSTHWLVDGNIIVFTTWYVQSTSILSFAKHVWKVVNDTHVIIVSLWGNISVTIKCKLVYKYCGSCRFY